MTMYTRTHTRHRVLPPERKSVLYSPAPFHSKIKTFSTGYRRINTVRTPSSTWFVWTKWEKKRLISFRRNKLKANYVCFQLKYHFNREGRNGITNVDVFDKPCRNGKNGIVFNSNIPNRRFMNAVYRDFMSFHALGPGLGLTWVLSTRSQVWCAK